MYRTILVLMALLAHSSAFAQPSPLKENEKVNPVRLLEYRDDLGHFIFVGKSERQFHVFDVRDGQAQEIPMVNGMSMFDGGSLMLDLEGGKYLFVPSDQKLNYVQGRSESYLLSPGAAREPLLKRKFNLAKLESLGVGSILAPPSHPPGRPPIQNEVKELALPAVGKLLFLDASKMETESRSTFEDSFKSLISGQVDCVPLDKNNQRLYMNTYAIVCSDAAAEMLKAKLSEEKELVVQEISSRESLFSGSGDLSNIQELMNNVADGKKAFALRMQALRSLLSRPSDWRAHRGTLEYAKTILGIHNILSQVNSLSEAVVDSLINDAGRRIANERRLEWNWRTKIEIEADIKRRVRSMPLYQTVAAPIRAQTVAFLDQIKNLGLEETDRLVLLHSGAAGGEAITHLLDPQMMSSWLNWWSLNLRPIIELPKFATPEELNDEKWSISSHSGGIFNQLHLSANLAGVSRWDEIQANMLLGQYELRDPGVSPLVQLGVSAISREAVKQILTFIIQSEYKIAAGLTTLNQNQRFHAFLRGSYLPSSTWTILRDLWMKRALTPEQTVALRKASSNFRNLSGDDIEGNLRRLAAEYYDNGDEDYKGSDLLHKFISRIGWVDSQFLNMPGFDSSLYYLNAIEVFRQLLEDSDRVLKNRDTYLTVLDAAWDLQNRLLNATPKTVRGKPRLLKAVHELGRTIQNRLGAALPAMQRSKQYADACEVLLSPNPGKKIRD